jgi:hypothetical protein
VAVDLPSALVASTARGQLILVVGTGASIAVTGRPDSPASWKGLLAHGIDYAAGQGLLSLEGAAAAQVLLDEGEFQSVGSLVKSVLKDCRADWLVDAFSSLELKPGHERLHNAIGAVPSRLIMTTNYDDLLERALLRGPVSWTSREFGMALANPLYAASQILHVHGYYGDDDSVVLDQVDYRSLERVDAMRSFETAAASQPLLFVGCGPEGLKDQHFRSLWQWLEKLGPTQQHYALIPESIGTPDTRAVTRANVRFVRYDDGAGRGHDGLPEALEQLAEAAAATTSQAHGVGRAAVKAPWRTATDRRVVVIAVQDLEGLSNVSARREIRSNLVQRLQRLLSLETRGADLCVLGQRLEHDVAAEVARNANAPLLAFLSDGRIELFSAGDVVQSSSAAVPAGIDFAGGLPKFAEPDSTASPLRIVDRPGDGKSGPVEVCLQATGTRVTAGGSARTDLTADPSPPTDVLVPGGTDAVLTFDVRAGTDGGMAVYGESVREVVYGLEQTSFARLSRVVEGTSPVTPDAKAELQAVLEGLDPSAFKLFRDDLAALDPDDERASLTHIAAPAHFRSASEAAYEAMVDDAAAQQKRLRLLPWTRPTLRLAGDASVALAADQRTDRRLLVAATLGEFDVERVWGSFPRQRTLLAFVAEQRLRLTYTLLSRPSEAHGMTTGRHFLIHCFAPSQAAEPAFAESQSVSAAVQSAFHNHYNLTYSTAVPDDLRDADIASGEAAGYSRVWVVPTAPGSLWPVSDYGFIGDYVRTLPGEVAVTWDCSGDLSDVTKIERTPPEIALSVTLPGPRFNAFDELKRLATESAFSLRDLALRCSVSVRGEDDNAARLADEVGKLVGTEVFGAGQFTVMSDAAAGYTAVSIGHALLAMHAPFGQMYATSFDTGRRFVRVLKDQRFEAGITLGTASRKAADRDYSEPVTLSEQERFHHLHVVGRPGVGKTTLLKQMIQGDMEAGNGVTVVDPHGGLADWVIANVPASRAQDVVFVDLENQAHAPVLNLLDTSTSTFDDYERVVSEIIDFVRRRNYHEWSGPVFGQLVRLALLSMRDPAYPAPPSITELPLLLGNDSVRRAMQQRVKSEDLKDGWRLQAGQSKEHFAELMQWAISKFDELTSDRTLRAFLGGEKSTLNLPRAVAEGKILIFRLASTRISEQASDFIGSMLLMALQQGLLDMATSRERPPHFVYIDEFHRFATLGLERLVVEARKFRVGMTLAHQNLAQLSAFQEHTGRVDQGVSSTLVGNAGTIVVFPVSSYDRDQLARELGCSSEEIGRLARFQALVRTAVTSGSIQPFTIEIDDMGEPDATEGTVKLAAQMRDAGIWQPITEVLDTVSERNADVRRWATGPSDGGDAPMSPPPTDPSGAGTFLDEWLAKRKLALPTPPDALGVGEQDGAGDDPNGSSVDDPPDVGHNGADHDDVSASRPSGKKRRFGSRG